MKLVTVAAVAASLSFAGGSFGQAATINRPMLHRTPAATPGWVPTATQALQLSNATDLGELSATTPLRIVVALPMRDRAGADSLLRQQYTPGSPSYHQFWTPEQFTASFNPSGAQVAAVASYLKINGLRGIVAEPNNLLVSATGPYAAVRTAFATKVDAFTQGGQTIYANVLPAQVPASLGGSVLSVLGLNNVQQRTFLRRAAPAVQARLRARRTVAPSQLIRPNAAASPPGCLVPAGSVCVANSYTAAGFLTAYDAGAAPPASSTSIAVMAEGNVSQVLPDLRTYESFNGLAAVNVKIVQVGLPSTDTAGQDEWDLDTQTSTAIAGTVKTLFIYVTTSLTDSDTTLEFSHWQHQNKARIGSASFGGCEIFAFADGTMAAADQIFLQAAAQGQTMFSSAGDNGFTCPVLAATGVPGTGLPFQSYPASSPYVMGVGGTTLLTNVADGSYNSEVTWIGTGGGLSAIENPPFWAAEAVPVFPSLPVGLRALPDIAMDADPNTGADIIVSGAHTGVGGTSLSSPLAMGIYARMQSRHGNKLGNGGPALYGAYVAAGGSNTPAPPPPGVTTQLIGGFNDILVGSNGAYTALPGYDLTTGLGTFDIYQLFRNFGS